MHRDGCREWWSKSIRLIRGESHLCITISNGSVLWGLQGNLNYVIRFNIESGSFLGVFALVSGAGSSLGLLDDAL